MTRKPSYLFPDSVCSNVNRWPEKTANSLFFHLFTDQQERLLLETFFCSFHLCFYGLKSPNTCICAYWRQLSLPRFPLLMSWSSACKACCAHGQLACCSVGSRMCETSVRTTWRVGILLRPHLNPFSQWGPP